MKRLLLLLGACAHVQDQKLQLEPGMVGIKALDGTQLGLRHWGPQGEPRAVVVIVHGLKDHSDRYQALGEQLAAGGYSVYAFDLRGHARSEGQRVYPESWLDYVNDLRVVLADVRKVSPGKPVFLFGHSMGGAIATLTAEIEADRIAGLMLSGPALAIDAPPILVPITRFLGAVGPGMAVLKLPNDKFSSDPKNEAVMDKDPWIEQGPAPAHTAAGLIDGMHKIWKHPERLTMPILAMHGSADQLTAPAGSRWLVEQAAATDKTLHIYDGWAHDLLHEPKGKEVADEIQHWLDAHTGGPAVAAVPAYTEKLAGESIGWTQGLELGLGYTKGEGLSAGLAIHAAGELAVVAPVGYHALFQIDDTAAFSVFEVHPLGVAFHQCGYAFGLAGGATATHGFGVENWKVGYSGSAWGELPAGPVHLTGLASWAKSKDTSFMHFDLSVRLSDVSYWPHAVAGVGPAIHGGVYVLDGMPSVYAITLDLSLFGAK